MKKYIILISVFIITLFLIYELNQYTVTKNIFTITTNIQGNCNELKIKAYLNGTFQQYGNSYELETTPFNLLLVLESEKEKNILLEQIVYVLNNQEYIYNIAKKISLHNEKEYVSIKDIPLNFTLYREFKIIVYYKEVNSSIKKIELHIKNNNVTRAGFKIFFQTV